TSLQDAWQALLTRWTEGCDDLPLQTLLTQHGVGWRSKPGSLTQQWGVRVQDANGTAKVQAVMRHGLAEDFGLNVGDELIALDGWRIKRGDDLAQWHDASRAQTLLVCRDQRLVSLTIQATQAETKPTAAAQRKARTGKAAGDVMAELASEAHRPEVVTLWLADEKQAPLADAIRRRRRGWLLA